MKHVHELRFYNFNFFTIISFDYQLGLEKDEFNSLLTNRF